MKDYLRRSLRQLYLLYFWPSRFEREVEGEKLGQPTLSFKQRAVYMLKMLPWTALLSVAANLAAGLASELFGIKYNWAESWGGVAGGVAVGVARGVAVGVAGGVAFGVAVGVARGVAVGVAGGVAFGVAFWLSYFRLYEYGLVAFLSSAAYLRRKKHALRAWRLCPVSWHEVIWLPLPFAGKILTELALQDREKGFEQIAFVFAERGLQRRVAQEALEEVGLHDLQAGGVKGLAQTAERLEWTTAGQFELPDAFSLSLPLFEQTARQIDQYLILQSAQRQSDSLDKAITIITGLQKQLFGVKGTSGPRLLRIANEWRGIIEAERKEFSARVSASVLIPNPFAFGNALAETEDNVFSGRRDVVERVESAILGSQTAPTLLLQGARRMGKTSILLQLPRLLGPDFAPVFVDCQDAAFTESPAAALRYLSRRISQGVQRRRVSVKPITRQELEREPYSAFQEWLERLEDKLPENLRVLLCLDEYERLMRAVELGWGGQFLDTLRHWMQHHRQLTLLFTGARAFEEMGKEWTDRFISARRLRVSFLNREDMELLLTKPIPQFDMEYAAGALEAVITATNGQPFLAQATAYELVELLNEQSRKTAAPADVERAVARALDNGGVYFADVWADAGPNGQALLQAVAQDQTPPDFPQARKWLREHDVLNDEGQFAVPMVRQWVRENKL
jgi:hypothetical protein